MNYFKSITTLQMEAFQHIQWRPMLVEEQHKVNTSSSYKTAHWVISEWKMPFPFEKWLSDIDLQCTERIPDENMYLFCAKRLTRPKCKQLVENAATRLELDPEHIRPFEKMASFFILKLIAGIHPKHIWDAWAKVPVTIPLLKDETFGLCMIALHPVLFGKLHPTLRNCRHIFLQAVALWNCPHYSILQFVHPRALYAPFRGTSPYRVCRGLKQLLSRDYWVFDDVSAVTRVIGAPGKRRWFELQYAGPSVIRHIVHERNMRGNDMTPLKTFLQKNKYIKSDKI